MIFTKYFSMGIGHLTLYVALTLSQHTIPVIEAICHIDQSAISLTRTNTCDKFVCYKEIDWLIY